VKVWFLEGYLGPQRALQRIRVSKFPFRIGREEDADLVIDSPDISRIHAELVEKSGRVLLVDRNSTNGTYLERNRIEAPRALRSGDIVHFAGFEFRVIAEDRHTQIDRTLTLARTLELPAELPRGSEEFQTLLAEARVTTLYQAIVRRRDEVVHAYEMLARGSHPDLPESPKELFRIAESSGLELALTELMRRVGIELAVSADPRGLYFLNIHPHEMRQPDRLLREIRTIRGEHPDLGLVLEIHEGAIADASRMADLKARLTDLSVKIAYDDFGAGQARLVELAEVPPDYVKLDMSLMRDIDRAPASRQEMVAMFVKYARESGVLVIAEGIESDGEARVCDELGIDFVQGFRYGRPAPLLVLTPPAR
jgi:EAL domain-containing protein (putative c-di-GMP-specific phosphodiesterase class I)